MAKHKSPYLRYLASGVLVAIAVYFCWPGPTNDDLKKRGIPPIPGPFKVLGSSQGGLFAQWFLMTVRLNEVTYEQYRKKVSADAGVELIVGKEVMIRKSEKTAPEDLEKGLELDFVESVNGEYFDWFDVDRIVQGTLYKRDLPDACGYKIYFDDQRKRVYINWHYS